MASKLHFFQINKKSISSSASINQKEEKEEEEDQLFRLLLEENKAFAYLNKSITWKRMNYSGFACNNASLIIRDHLYLHWLFVSILGWPLDMVENEVFKGNIWFLNPNGVYTTFIHKIDC